MPSPRPPPDQPRAAMKSNARWASVSQRLLPGGPVGVDEGQPEPAVVVEPRLRGRIIVARVGVEAVEVLVPIQLLRLAGEGFDGRAVGWGGGGELDGVGGLEHPHHAPDRQQRIRAGAAEGLADTSGRWRSASARSAGAGPGRPAAGSARSAGWRRGAGSGGVSGSGRRRARRPLRARSAAAPARRREASAQRCVASPRATRIGGAARSGRRRRRVMVAPGFRGTVGSRPRRSLGARAALGSVSAAPGARGCRRAAVSVHASGGRARGAGAVRRAAGADSMAAR